jgi:DNA polymerase I-like protein with 3'-5' exonuclease and polymerase domains
MVGADLEGLELRALGHYLHRFDEGAFADVVCNGDIHQQNADRVGCTRTQVKTLTYAFIYGAGDQKLGHSLHPEMSDAQKKSLGSDLRVSSLMLSLD